MPIQVTCPSCQTTLKTADSSAGKRAKCPQCGGVLDIPIPVAAVVEDDEYGLEAIPAAAPLASNQLGGATPASDADRRPCPACGEMIARKAIKCRFCNEIFDRSLRGIATGAADVHDPGWLKVRSGLANIYYSITLIVVTAVLLGVMGAVVAGMGAEDNRPGGEPPALLILLGIGGFIILGSFITLIIGQVRCASVPADSGAKGYATGAAICMAITIILSFVGKAPELEAIQGLSGLTSLISSILFILFIRKSASYLDAPDLASSAGRYLMFTVLAFVMGFGVGIAGAISRSDVLMGILGLGLILCVLIGLIWYLRLVKGLMTTIDLRMSAR